MNASEIPGSRATAMTIPCGRSHQRFTTIVFETHATSLDNEAGIASGHDDVDLSALGIQQAKELGHRYAAEILAAVICSDLRRSYRTAEIAFGASDVPILRDRRLRECDYGDLTGSPVDVLERERCRRVHRAFPNGESYVEATERVREVVGELAVRHAGQRVLLIGHRATWYSLEYLLRGVPLAQTIATPWVWQPGWEYRAATDQCLST